jgi:chemotaxis protein methyltransferase CheR
VTTQRNPALARDAAFPRLKQLVAARTGHAYYDDKDDLLAERLARRLRANGSADVADYLELLLDPEAGDAEWNALAGEITIGETFFFRDAGQFAALERIILPAILEANGATRRIRIWSAGCANGAEPYTVAILLRRLLGPALAEWQVSILGTDINPEAVASARRGRFGAWSLRTLSAEERLRDFLPADGARAWTLRPEHRGLVRFAQHNLMDLLHGAAPLHLADFDLILCRNVLIYFNADTADRMVGAFGERLAPRGWLLLGHAEAGIVPRHGLATVELPGTLAYRRIGAAPHAPPRDAEALADPVPAQIPALPPALPPRPATPLPALLAADPVQPAGDAPDMLAAVRALADRGELDDALAACAAALRREPTNAALHYVEGLVAATRGERDSAERAFRRAVYLRRDFVLAHHQLGLLLNDAGRPEAGMRALRNALQIAGAMPPDSLLDEGDGLTAAGFRAMARRHLARAGAEAPR